MSEYGLRLKPLKEGIMTFMQTHEGQLISHQVVCETLLIEFPEFSETDFGRALLSLWDSQKLYLTTGGDISLKPL